jgi:hypothetical protein
MPTPKAFGAKSADPLTRLRQLCFALPDVVEKISHGTPTFWAGSAKSARTFAIWADDHHGSGRTTVWVKSTLDEQQAMVETAAATFFVPPYVGPSGWVGVYLDGKKPGWDALPDLLREGWKAAAPKRLLGALNG